MDLGCSQVAWKGKDQTGQEERGRGVCDDTGVEAVHRVEDDWSSASWARAVAEGAG